MHDLTINIAVLFGTTGVVAALYAWGGWPLAVFTTGVMLLAAAYALWRRGTKI